MMKYENNCIADCKKYLGLPPYNTNTNIVEGDWYYYKYLCEKYGCENVKNTIRSLKGGAK